MIGTTARWLVPLLLPAVAEAHPRITVVVIDATTTSLSPMLDSRLDLAVVALPVNDPDVETEPLFDEDLVLVAPDHPLDQAGPVTIAELAEHPLLLGAKGTAFRDDLDVDAAGRGSRSTRRPRSTGCGCWRRSPSRASAAVLPATAAPRSVPPGPGSAPGSPVSPLGRSGSRPRPSPSSPHRAAPSGTCCSASWPRRAAPSGVLPPRLRRPSGHRYDRGRLRRPPGHGYVPDSITITDNRTGESVEVPIVERWRRRDGRGASSSRTSGSTTPGS